MRSGCLMGTLVTTLTMSSVVLADGETTLYRLQDGSTFERGCFEGCACPITEPVALEGTFELVGEYEGLPVNIFEITNVNWQVPELDLEIHGSGTYVIHAEFVSFEQMELDLTVTGEPEEHFDSGFVLGGGDFPEITITMTINDYFCYDTELTVVALPVEPADVNGDGAVDVADLLMVLAAWGPCTECAADVDGDGTVNVVDLLMVLSGWHDA